MKPRASGSSGGQVLPEPEVLSLGGVTEPDPKLCGCDVIGELENVFFRRVDIFGDRSEPGLCGTEQADDVIDSGRDRKRRVCDENVDRRRLGRVR